MKNILIPTDFSKNAWHAIEYALLFFKDETCTFYLLHTYTPAFYRIDYLSGGPEISGIPDVGVDISMSGLEKTLEDIEREFPNPRYRFELVSSFNTLTDEIRDISERKQIDLIVMGTQGATGAKQVFLGSNTVWAIRKAHRPLLAVPSETTYRPPRMVLFPSDYRGYYKREDLQPMLDIIRAHDSRVLIFHMKEEAGGLTDAQKDNQRHLERCMEEIEYEIVEEKGGNLPEAILRFIEEHPIDLLVMTNRSHTFFERLLVRQNIDQIGFHIKIPFLVVPDHSEPVK
ncbi:universal stress protein [Robiginitalea sp. SC105]|uniref:universal stress protein n=1 Tax=Robiginitalea sp. SC105 TaxID=2762332 RepID=UPI00163B2D82|nr:universal stress protein [Robiginitalea sp. SC105]MBC2839557.1 universal stress protein [Robiginitalea sp. SC105]